jgi:hypothetical protein
MKQGKRFGLSAEQKSDVWRRWKSGQTLHEIGRASLTMSALSNLFKRTSPFTPKSGLLCCYSTSASTTTARFVISRSVSVRLIHLFDPYFDHDY